MREKLTITLASAALAGALYAAPASADVSVKLELVASGLTAPLTMVSPPGDDRRFIVEQIGHIRVLTADGKLLEEPFLNIREKLIDLSPDFDEEGMLGLAFHPDYANNGKFYVTYSGPVRDEYTLDKHLWYAHTNYVAEFHVSKDDPNVADPLSERILMHNPWPQFNHNGHWIGFGPDGFLYISTGDGGYANDWGIGHNVTMGNGQDMQSLLGKILRIDVNNTDGAPYGIPADNPFVGNDDVLDEIWASGMRNPWRCSFDMGGDHALFCGNVGQNSFEEIELVTKGSNHGWRKREGRHCFDYVHPDDHPASCDTTGLTDPIIEYKNCNVFDDCKGLSVTGGYVYRGSHAPWQGKYFFGDWSAQFGVRDGALYVGSNNGGTWTMEDVKVTNMDNFNSYVLGFGQDNNGDIYVMATDTTGPVGGLDRIYKIVPAN